MPLYQGLGAGVAALLGGTPSGTVGLVGTTSPTLVTPAIGAATGVSLNLSGQLIGGGTVTNDDAAAGMIGELLSATLGAVALTTATPKTIVGVSLTAGDWLIRGSIGFLPAATTSITKLRASLSATADTHDTALNRQVIWNMPATVPTGQVSQLVMPVRWKLASTTTINLVGDATFTVSTMSSQGWIEATRIR